MDTDNKTLYDIIGVPKFASEEIIEEACLRLAEICRPDKNPGDPAAALLFQEVETVYATLTDPAKREAYEASLLDAHMGGDTHASRGDAPDTSLST